MMMEKALPAKRRRAAKGTVLFTVVAVMMVLIVFLMGTLALAATANKRAQRNYQKEQTEYTARAVLDSVIQKINEDTTGTGLKRDIADGTVSSLTVTIDDGSPNPPTQTVNIQKLMNGTNEVTRGIYTGATDGWKDVPLYMLSVNIASSTTSAETTYTALVTAGLRTGTGSGGGGGGGGAFVSMGDVQTDIGTGGYVSGGSYINVGAGKTDPANMKTFKIQGSGSTIIDAPLYVNGHMDPGDSADLYIHFTGTNEFFAVMGDISFTKEMYTMFYDWKNLGTTSYKAVPAIYVGGEFKVSGGATGLHLGTEDIPVNVFTGSFDIEGNNGHGTGIHGDLYAFNPDKTSIIWPNDDTTKLYKWTKATVTKAGSTNQETFGNIYAAGNLLLGESGKGNGTLNVEGSVRCNKDVTISRDCTIGGDLVVGGKLTIASGVKVTCQKILASQIENNGSVTAEAGTVYTNAPITGTSAAILSNNTASTKTWYTADLANVVINGNRWTADVSVVRHHEVNGTEEPTKVIIGPVNFTVDGNSENEAKGNFLNKIRENINTYMTFPNEYFSDQNDYNNNYNKTIVDSATRLPAAVVVGTDTIATRNGGEIYPVEYESTKMPGAVFTEPVADDYTKNYITKLEKLDPSIYSGGYKVPTIDFDTAGSDGFYTVDHSCVLTGTKNSGNIYINTTDPTITVILDKLKMNTASGGPVIVANDDKTKITLVVVNDCSIGSIITENYINILYGTTYNKETVSLGKTFTEVPEIPQEVDLKTKPADKKYLPNVIVYGIEGSKLSVPDGANGFLTAQIRAPKMKYYHRLGTPTIGIKYLLPNGTTMNYDGAVTTYDGGKSKSVGVIGQLIADGIDIDAAAAWGMLYVHEKDYRCAACKAAGCTSCTGATGCTCSCAGCAYHTTSPPPSTPSGSVNFAENFNVLYYSVY